MEYMGWTVKNGRYVHDWWYEAELVDPEGIGWGESTYPSIANFFGFEPSVLFWSPPIFLNFALRRQIRKFDRTRNRSLRYRIR